jgi:N4-gp56 family major capsid protein
MPPTGAGTYVEVLTTHGQTVEQWDEDISREYLGQLLWRHFMGTGPRALIQVKAQLTKGPGDKITVGHRGKLQGGRVSGRNKLRGNEGRFDIFSQKVEIDNERVGVLLEDVPMTRKRVTWDILQEAKVAIQEAATQDLDDAITTALSDTTTGRVRGRTLYGRLDTNWDATHATALANIADDADGNLSTRQLGAAKRKLKILEATTEARVSPAKLKAGKAFEEWFVCFAHDYCVRDLKQGDAAWRNAQLLLPPNANRDSVLYTGSAFVGTWEGVMVYMYDRLTLESSTVQVAHNLMMGAQAGFVAWGQMSQFNESEKIDYGHDVGFELHEIRGIEKAVYDRDSGENHALVDMYSSAVVDG